MEHALNTVATIRKIIALIPGPLLLFFSRPSDLLLGGFHISFGRNRDFSDFRQSTSFVLVARGNCGKQPRISLVAMRKESETPQSDPSAPGPQKGNTAHSSKSREFVE